MYDNDAVLRLTSHPGETKCFSLVPGHDSNHWPVRLVYNRSIFTLSALMIPTIPHAGFPAV